MIKDLDKKVAHAMELHYERGFIDGMQKQMQSSVDKAVNRMAQKQEPVAWTLADKVRQDLDRQSCPDAFMRIAVESIVKHHPPQRIWVGLTDEEITGLHHEIKVRLMGTYKTEDIYRAIEARLKELNT